tara:strand:+ start:180 stop:482 length:303 start_codon:yes stop_codon:yes gene_type:complete
MVNQYNYQLLKHNTTNEHLISDSLSDYLFKQGYRHIRYLKNSEINVPELIATQEEDFLDRLWNGSFNYREAIKEGSHPYYSVKDLDEASDPYFRQQIEIY